MSSALSGLKKPRYNFVLNDRMGRVGEQLVYEHPNSFFGDDFVYSMDDHTKQFKTEGLDYGVRVLHTEPNDVFFEDAAWYTYIDPKFNPFADPVTPIFLRGGIEVKTTGGDQSLRRTRFPKCTSCIIPFTLWDEKNSDGVGFLQRLFHPDQYEKSVEPLAFVDVFVYDKTPGKEDYVPFAVVAFTRFKELRQRLIEVYDGKLDFESWTNIPDSKNINEWTPPEGVNVQGAMLLVPLDKLADLATVTLVGNPPPMFANGKSCPIKLQKTRWEHLVACAGERHLDLNTPPEILPGTDSPFEKFLGQFYTVCILAGGATHDQHI